MQPIFTQVPPIRFFSMTATFFPYPAALLAQAKPPSDYNSILILPEPPPITIKSKCNIELIF